MNSRINASLIVSLLFFVFSFSIAAADTLLDAIESNDLASVKQVLQDDNALLNKPDIDSRTPLHHAIMSGNVEIAMYLIEQGADVNAKDKDNESPLHVAAFLGNVDIIESLVEHGATTINEPGFRQLMPLHYAIDKGHLGAVNSLLENGADIEAREIGRRTPIMLACGNHDMDLIDILIEHGADLSATITRGPTTYDMLMVAVWYGFEEFAKYLIEEGMTIKEDDLGYAFYLSVQNGMTGLFDHTLEAGIDLVEIREDDPSLIITAVNGGSASIVEAFLESGYTLDTKDKDGWTPLHYAAVSNQVEIIELLAARGVEIDARNAKGETAYNLAVFHGSNESAEYLMLAGADSSAPEFPELTGPYMGQEPPGDTPKLFLPGIVSGHFRAHSSIIFSPDATEAYWTEMRPPEGKVLGTKIVDGVWSYPEESIMGRDPSFSPDGNRLYFIKLRPLKPGEKGTGEKDAKEEYWYIERTESGWSEPKSTGEAVNRIGLHWPCSVDNQGHLFFSEFSDNMYVSEYEDGEYLEPVNLKEFCSNETYVGRSPFISPDGDYILFSGSGGLNVGFRKSDGSWTNAIHLGDTINSRQENGSPRVTADGKYLFFLSAGPQRPWGIYWVSAAIIDRLREEHIGSNN